MVADPVPPDLAETLDRWLSDQQQACVEDGPFGLLAWLFDVHLARLSAGGTVVSWRAVSCTDAVVAERAGDRLTLDLAVTLERTVTQLGGTLPPERARKVVTGLEWRCTEAGWRLWDEAVEGVWRSALACVGRVGAGRGPLRATRVGALAGRRPMAWVEFANDTERVATVLERPRPTGNTFRDWMPRPGDVRTLLMLPPHSAAVVPVRVADLGPGVELSYFGELDVRRRHLERLDVPLGVEAGHLGGRGWCPDSLHAAGSPTGSGVA